MAAENNLSNIAQLNLTSMIAGRRLAAADENLVVFVDRASSKELPFLALVTTNEQQPLDTLYRYEEDFYASSAQMMTDVLSRAVQLCPATEDYGLVLWGHANGWIIENDSIASTKKRAYGVDSGNNGATLSGKWMNIPSMREALELLPVKFKFIFADCCNMANAEIAYELRNVTEYLIASPAEITGNGAPYGSVVKDFFKHNDKEMYQSLCDDYYAQKDAANGHTPLVAINTSAMEALAAATRGVLPQINDYITANTTATQGMIYYYAWDLSREAEKTLYDMNDMVRSSLGSDATDYANWLATFRQAVVYSKTSTYWHANEVNFLDFTTTGRIGGCFLHGDDSFGGMSMFFPMEKYNTVTHRYNESIKQLAWYYAVGWPEVGW